ncbi:hypothetical protein [Nannocystis sp. SCPEA4]|uniref:hypothetical protein n=1 Tax=Nannocystis sp. SCPEA4 TaxID=2996787 RepID=UPI0022709675|nr:hypothetical protein [Nannocystis sp. SCPEA4]MCY1060021.1 hypothetical protein [Nannocystis sp. SCPEA4]
MSRSAGPDPTDDVSNVVAALYFAPAVKPADLLARLRDGPAWLGVRGGYVQRRLPALATRSKRSTRTSARS